MAAEYRELPRSAKMVVGCAPATGDAAAGGGDVECGRVSNDKTEDGVSLALCDSDHTNSLRVTKIKQLRQLLLHFCLKISALHGSEESKLRV